MTHEQILLCCVLVGVIVTFISGKWRHDLVALAALLACVLLGLVPGDQAFYGFGHPAVITVACVLVLSKGLQNSGAVDHLARAVIPAGRGKILTIGILTALSAGLSAFMNNVGALALLMPIALQVAARHDLPPGKVLMPVAFGSIFGGMTTLIGTPPNLIVSGFRETYAGEGFGMFDFTPVGLAVAAAGVLFLALVGWRLVPTRERADAASFATGGYLTEVVVPENSKAAGRSLADIGPDLARSDAQVVGMVRHDERFLSPHPRRVLRPGDILVIEAEPDALTALLGNLGFELSEDVRPEQPESDEETADTKNPREEIVLSEVVARPLTKVIGRSATDLQLRSRHGINLLALSRKGRRSISRLRSERIRPGDVLLLQGTAEAIAGWAADHGCVPLARRDIQLPKRRQAALATGIMAAVLGLVVAGWLSAAVAFALGVLAVVLTRIVPLRTVYDAIDWPVVVLLAALIPVAGAMATTGTAAKLASWMVESLAMGKPVVALLIVLVVTMTLSDFMNNAATAAVMCPIAIGIAAELGVRSDPFLMAVAIGASCAFLTPIGHQNNTLILGPGGFRFSDYWRLGLPLEILVIALGTPLLLFFWPL